MSSYRSFSIPAMKSRYNSTCKFCQKRIAIGDPIAKHNNIWGHHACALAAQKQRTGTPALLAADAAPAIAAKSITAPAFDVDTLLAAIDTSTTDEAQDERDATPAPVRVFSPSAFQRDIFHWIVFGTGHAVVEAVAGSGKTTTNVHAVKYLPLAVAYERGHLTQEQAQHLFDNAASDEWQSLDANMVGVDVGFVAFNKHIAAEMGTRLPEWCYSSTLHSLGYSDLKDALGRNAVSVDEQKRWDALYPIAGDDFTKLPWKQSTSEQRAARRLKQNNLKKLVGLAKACLLDEHSDAGEIYGIVDHFGLDLNGDTERIIEALPVVLAACKDSTALIDFEDMQWLPVALNLPMRKFDYLFIDEAQDLNMCQAEFILRSIKPNGRIIAVGDRKQSLYGFRGADVNAIPSLIERLAATVLPLSITYRCPTSHVKLAQRIVPQLTARDDAPEGVIADMTEVQMAQNIKAGDMVVCRTNAPLVPVAFGLIRRGIKVVIRGKDIGANLSELAKKLADGAENMQEFYFRLSEYTTREMNRLAQRNAPETQVQALQDKSDTLNAVAGECDEPIQVSQKIESIFSDDNGEIVLSSVHRAKGLESDTVWIVRPDLMPFPKVKQDWEREQEANIEYVALTRSKNNLYFVK